MEDNLNINFYYDTITKLGPVPNGLSKYHVKGQFEETSLWDKPFDLNFVDNPSLVQPICNFYETLTHTNEVSLYTNKEFCKNLFYPIELSLKGINCNIPDSTLVNLRKGKLKLLLLAQTFQGYWELSLVKHIATVFANMQIPADNIFIVTSDVNNSYKELFYPFKSFSIDWWQIESQLIIKNKTEKYKNFMKQYPAELNFSTNEFDINNFNPELLFHTYSQYDTNHRKMLIERLKQNNLYDKGTVISEEDHIDYHKNSLFTILTPQFAPHKDSPYKSEINSIFTNLDMWKLIVIGKPFIVLGCQQTIKYLNKQGYFTSYNIINEKYDSYLDLDIRIDLICKELKRIVKSKEIIETIKSIAKVNQNKFLTKSFAPNFLNLFDKIRYG